MSKVLVIVTNHPELAGEPNGTYLPELTHALHELRDAGVEYELASPKGGRAPVYGKDADEVTISMLAEPAFVKALEETSVLKDVNLNDFDAIYFPGGYGLLFDLVDNPDSHDAVLTMLNRNAPISAVCHGPAALGNIKFADGTPIVAGRNVTGFTREEEIDYKTIDKIPFLLEEQMINSDATYQKRKIWVEFVVEDGNIITGQNPASAAGIGQALVARLT